MITVTGASDDLIEIDGDISEEFYANDEDPNLLAFSDGTILRVDYTPAGVWRIVPVASGSATVRITQAPEDDDRNYTDRADLIGDVWWVAHATDYAKVKG